MTKKYSPEGIVAANVTVALLVHDWLQRNSFTKEQWLRSEFNGIKHYLQMSLPADNQLHNLATKYGSLDTYLSYLIHNIKFK